MYIVSIPQAVPGGDPYAPTYPILFLSQTVPGGDPNAQTNPLFCFYTRLFVVEIPMPLKIPSFVSIPN